MKTKLILASLLLIFSGIFFLGCFGVDSNFSKIKNEVFSTVGVQFNKDIEFGIGPAGLSFVSVVVNISDADVETCEIIRHLSKVQIGVYKKYQPVSRLAAIQILRNIDDRMLSGGWSCIVKDYDKSDVSTIYVKHTEDSKLRELFIVNLSKDELTIVNLKGRLDEVIPFIIKDKNMSF